MIEVENTNVNIVRNLIPMRIHMPTSAYGLKAISDWFFYFIALLRPIQFLILAKYACIPKFLALTYIYEEM